jgi:hypothetical protein
MGLLDQGTVRLLCELRVWALLRSFQGDRVNPQDVKTNAIKFLGHMLTNPQVMTDLQKAPDAVPGQPGKDASAVGDVMAKHLGIPKPTNDEVAQMGQHIQDAMKGVNATLSQHAPAQAQPFSPSNFCILNNPSTPGA